MQPSASRLIFVYGTLMEGEGNWSWALAPRKALTRATTLPGFRLLHLGGFPGMVRVDALEVVRGEIFEIEDSELPKFDRLEGHPHFYRREEIRVLPPGEAAEPIRLETYIYQGRQKGKLVIPSGSWLEPA